jgi:ABC-2 type transport system ATP-binding protein
MRAMDSLPEYALEAEGLTKTYRRRKGGAEVQALKGVDLKVPRGAIFGLLGPNGAGKSTMINIFAGLVMKSGGTARIWGMDIDREPRNARAAIGIVPQEINMDPFFSPFESLEFQAGFYGVPPKERRTLEILDMVGLLDKKDAYTRSLSGGMKRRLLVAKALVHSPPILVLDEPTAGVDIELRRQLWDNVRRLHERGTTVVLTTHYLEEAQELCETIAIINHGEVVACEPTATLLRRIDTKTLVIQPATPLSAVPATLAAYDASIRKDGALVIVYHYATQPVAEIIERAKEGGVAIADLATQEPDLEDVFLQLTYNRPA